MKHLSTSDYIKRKEDNMNSVEPIKDIKKVKEILKYLKEENSRAYIMFLIGIHSGLGITEILKLKVEDVKNKEYIRVKNKNVIVSNKLKKELNDYCRDKNYNDHLLQSRNGKNKPLTRGMAYKIIRSIGEQFDLNDIGTQTLKKTFIYHTTKQLKELNI